LGDIKLGPVGSYVTLTNIAGYGYRFAETIDRKDIRTKGQLYTYIQNGSWHKLKIPASYVNSADRSLINSWWKTATNLLFFEDSDQTSTYHTVRIMGVQEPFQSFVRPYFRTYYAGEIILETV